jgi:mannan endo-1,4-beta-mannosidase
MRIYILIALFLTSFGLTAQKKNASSFVEVVNGELVLDGERYCFVGSNYWQGMNLGAPESGDRIRLLKELDQLKDLGVKNLRILAASEADSEMKYAIHPALQDGPGEYNEDIWKGLDYLLVEMKKRGMTATMVLGNFWTWSGGFPQYLKWSGAGDIPFPQEEGTSWKEFTDYSKTFYTNEKAQKMMEDHIRKVISRVNHLSGKPYLEDPTIMAWQLANEPRGYDTPELYRDWTRRTSSFIKSLDQNHLVCLGSEGDTGSSDAGVNVLLDNDNPDVDYITMHIWPQNWGWFDPENAGNTYDSTIEKIDAYWSDHMAVAKKLKKPIVFEEFGIARDGGSFSIDGTVTWRDKFYTHFFNQAVQSMIEGDPVQGINFWTYSGTGFPPRPGDYWKKGDIFTGDPPHELQGWYGVYETDSNTLSIISNASKSIKNKKK